MKISALRLGAASATFAILAVINTANAQTLDLGEIVVTPSRTPMERARVGSTVNTVDEQEIADFDLPVAIEYLDRLPGITTTSPGGMGQEGTTVEMRGLPRRYIKTLFNGIDIGDPTAPQVQTSHQYLLAGNLAGIEVLKGSQSTLYGSEAIAGVIAFSTLGDIEPGVSHHIHAEGGSFGTVLGSYGLRAATLDSRMALNVTGLHTDGISAAAAGTERDGYRNMTFDMAGEHRFSEDFSVFGSLLYLDAKADFDDSGFFDFMTGEFIPPTDNLTAVNLSRQLAGRAGFNLDLMDGRFRNTVSVQAFDIERSIEGTTFDGVYDGRRYKFDYQGAFDINEWLTVQGGIDHERESAGFPEGAFNPSVDSDMHMTSLWSEALIEPLDDLTLTAGLRHDMHSDFGDHTTWRATGSYALPGTGTRFHSSIGTGFRAPALAELFGPFGANPDLEPETSLSFDAGIEQRFWDGRAIADITFFHIDVDDLIIYGTPGYVNVEGTSRSRGVEVSTYFDVNPWLDIGAAYTYTDAVNAAGERNIRIPRHSAALTAVVKPAERWTVSASARVALDTVDQNDFELDDYVLLNAKIAYKPTDNSEIYLRADNILDQSYQTVRGYNTPGFSVFAGVKASFGP